MAEVVLSICCCFIGFNLLIGVIVRCMRVKARSTLITYGWNWKIMKNNAMTIKTDKMMTQDQVTLNILSFLLGQSDHLDY